MSVSRMQDLKKKLFYDSRYCELFTLEKQAKEPKEEPKEELGVVDD